MKRIGLALLAATMAPTAFATGGYSEMWNPPEARTTAPHSVSAAHKLVTRRHVAPHAVKVHARRAPTSATRLMAKQHLMQEVVPAKEPDMSDIPRKIAPEGNVLRVSSRGASAKVGR